MNLGQKVTTLEEKVRPLEAAVLVGQRAATDVQLVRMEIEELKGFGPRILEGEEAVEKLADEIEERFSQMEVDVKILEATQQALS